MCVFAVVMWCLDTEARGSRRASAQGKDEKALCFRARASSVPAAIPSRTSPPVRRRLFLHLGSSHLPIFPCQHNGTFSSTSRYWASLQRNIVFFTPEFCLPAVQKKSASWLLLSHLGPKLPSGPQWQPITRAVMLQ